MTEMNDIKLTSVERRSVEALSKRTIPLVNILRRRQRKDGSITEPTRKDRARLTELASAAGDALVALGRGSQADALHSDIDAWLRAGLECPPEFDTTRDSIVPPENGGLTVFVGPARMTNAEPPVKRGFEAFVARRREPASLGAIGSSFPHPKNICQSLQLITGSDGAVVGNCLVFFPENIPARSKLHGQSFAMFFYNKFRRIHETFAVPAARAVLTADSLPWASAGLEPNICYEARATWGYLHDYFHHRGPRPFDEHMAVKLNWFVGLLEEIKVDSQTVLVCATGEVPLAAEQIDMILLERMFRYPLDPTAESVFDSGTGVLLFSWLREWGAITNVGDGRLRLSLDQTYRALAVLVRDIEAIEVSASTDDEYRAAAERFVRRYLLPSNDGDRYAFTADQSVLRRYIADAAGTPALRFGVGEL